MRIKTLELDNFRCYKHSEIDLSADITAIFARNGTGKTAIFDAIEFTLLGDIGRFKRSDDNCDFYSCVHTNGNPSVTIEFENDDCFKRLNATKKRNSEIFSITLDNKSILRKDLLFNFLADDNYFTNKDEQMIKDMFRSTLLLSQNDIRNFIEIDDRKDNSNKRFKILSYLSGFAYYQRCLDKTDLVLDEVKKREKSNKNEIKDAETKVAESKASISEIEARINAIKQKIGNEHITYNSIYQLIESMKIFSDNKQIPGSEDTASLLAVIKGVCYEKQNEINKSLKDLSVLFDSSHLLQEYYQKKNSYINQTDQAKAKLMDLESMVSSLVISIKAAEELGNVYQNNQHSYSLQYKKLQNYADKRVEREELEKSCCELSKEETVLLKQENDLNTDYISIKNDLNELTRLVEENKVSYGNLSLLTSKLKNLFEKITDYEKLKIKNSELELNIKLYNDYLITLEEERRNLQKAIAQVKENSNKTYKKLEFEKAKTGELESLLAKLKGYVSSNKCPLCGYPHDSENELKIEIDKQLSILPMELMKLTEEVKQYNQEIQDISMRLTLNSGKITSYTNEIEIVKLEFEKNITFLHSVESEASVLNQNLDESQLSSTIALYEIEKEKIIVGLNNYEGLLKEKERKAKETEITLNTKQKTLQECRSKVSAMKSGLKQIENTISELGFSVEYKEMPVEQIVDEVKIFVAKAAEAEQQQAKANLDKSHKENELILVRNEKQRTEHDIAEISNSLIHINAEIVSIFTICDSMNIEHNNIEEQVNNKQKEFQEYLERLNELIIMADKYEMLKNLDILNKEKCEFEQNYKNAQLNCSVVKEMHRKLNSARETADSWRNILTETLNSVVETRINYHIPEIIQLFKGMIPNSYLFEEIKMKRVGDALKLGLVYRGYTQDVGEPEYFLSNAQSNILALSIFLSFATKQSWSKLNTILFDDPVQHLDDLDALALLDNIRNVALGKFSEKKQIVISTCDQNLYLLMIKKFKLLTNSGVSFTAISLNENGVEGPDIIYDVNERALPLKKTV